MNALSDTSYFALPLRIPLKPSNRVFALMLLSQIGALISLYFPAIPLGMKAGIATLILLSLRNLIKTHKRRLKLGPTEELILNDKNEWYIKSGEDEMRPVSLLPTPLVHPNLIVMVFAQGRRLRSVVLTPNEVPTDTFRRLKVRMKFTYAK